MDNLKTRILKERGLIRTTSVKPGRTRGTFGKFIEKPKPKIFDKNKTPLIKYLETKYQVNIEELLLSTSLNGVVKKLGGEVDRSTISKWIKKYKLKYTEDNLPSCENCDKWSITCDSGVCQILVNLDRWDLIPLKRKQIQDELNKQEGGSGIDNIMEGNTI